MFLRPTNHMADDFSKILSTHRAHDSTYAYNDQRLVHCFLIPFGDFRSLPRHCVQSPCTRFLWDVLMFDVEVEVL